MNTSKSILILAILFLCSLDTSFSAAAQQGMRATKRASPDLVVANLYRQHKKRSPFFQTRSRALVDMYFEKTLADLIWRDAVQSKGEVGLLDGDPLYNAQDMEIENFSIHKPTFGNGHAAVLVSFENFGKKKEFTFLLVLRKNSWKVANIKYEDGTDLVGILSGKPSASQKTSEIRILLAERADKRKSGATWCEL